MISNLKELLPYFLTSLVFSFIVGFSLIKLFNLLNIKQFVREDGPQDHILKKSNTPTMGGLIFLIPVFIISLFLIFNTKNIQRLDLIVVLVCTALMALVGLIDDFLKVLKKHNKGVSGWLKLFIQFIISLFLYYKYFPESNLIYLIWVFFIFAGASNSYNLTDGLDGLLASISILSFSGFFILLNSNSEISAFLIIFTGALIVFLYFNKHPAKVFMGDTGSLAIGAAIGTIAIITKKEFYLIAFATIPILEALSVILQVLSCKLSKKFLGVDKRIFKMAPLHHHFELCGWKETDIVKRFFFLQLICTIIGIIVSLVQA